MGAGSEGLTAAEKVAAAAAKADPRFQGVVAELLPDHGLAHAHYRLGETGALVRAPKQSQMDLAPADALAHEAACFQRAAPSGATPRLFGVISPEDHPPRGALIVEEITGRVAGAADMPALAKALAAIHASPAPHADASAPLLAAADPVLDVFSEIGAQAVFVNDADLGPKEKHQIGRGLAELGDVVAQPQRPPARLISFDAHPGNFLVRADGSAVLVDLEQARYASPTLDLAHASLYTSTTWDIATSFELSLDEIEAFYEAWLEAMTASGEVEAREVWGPWIAPMRLAMWLRSITWCAKWRVLSAGNADETAFERDMAAYKDNPEIAAHVRDRVDAYLSIDVIAQVRQEIALLAGRFG